MPIPLENNSWDYVQRLIEKEIHSAFKLRDNNNNNNNDAMTTTPNMFPKDHPYMKQLDKVLKPYFVIKVTDVNGAHHGEEYEEMKAVILDALFINKQCKTNEMSR